MYTKKFETLILGLFLSMPVQSLLAQNQSSLEQQRETTKKQEQKKQLTSKDDSYWTDKYAEIKRILEGLPAEESVKSSTKARKPQTEKKTAVVKTSVAKEVRNFDKYDSTIVVADSLLLNKEYKSALGYYNEASQLKPDRLYAARMIDYIKAKVGELELLQKKSEELQRKALVNKALAKANDAVLKKDWENAKKLYSDVLNLEPIPSLRDFAEKKIVSIDLELERSVQKAPVKKEPVVVKVPKNKREAKAFKKAEERSAILAGVNKKTTEKETESEKTAESNVSYKIKNTFYTEFSDAQNINWSLKPNFVVVDFLQEGKLVEASYDLDANLIGVSRHLTRDELPMSTKTAFGAKFPTYEIKEVIYFVGPQEVAYYVSAEDEKELVIFKVTGKDDIALFKAGVPKNQNNPALAVVSTTTVDDVKSKQDAAEVAIREEKSRDVEKINNIFNKAETELTSSNYQAAKALYNEVLGLGITKEQEQLAKRNLRKIDNDLSRSTPRKTDKNESPVVVEKVQVKNKQTQTAPVVSAVSTTTTTEATPNLANVIPLDSYQKQAIEYTKSELLRKFPALNFDEVPAGQVFETVDDDVKQECKLISQEVLSETPRLNLSDINNDVKVICQGITFNGNNAYFKLLVQNNSFVDFPTGTIQFTHLKENGSLRKLNPRFVSDFPVIMPDKVYPIVYVAAIPTTLSAGDVFVLDMADRLKETKLSIIIPSSVVNQQRDFKATK